MHMAKLEREVEKMLLGEEDKIQWGELLKTFCQLQKGRVEIALESLTIRQLDILEESIKTVREDVLNTNLENARTEVLKLGLDPIMVARYLTGQPLEGEIESTNKAKKTAKKSNYINYREKFGKSVQDIVTFVAEENNLTPPVSAKQIKECIAGTLYDEITLKQLYSPCYEYNKKHGTSLK